MNKSPIDEVIAKVAAEYHTSPNALIGISRIKELVLPRHIAIYLIYKYLDLSLPKLATIFNRDHTTILYAYRKIERKMAKNPVVAHTINLLWKKINE